MGFSKTEIAKYKTPNILLALAAATKPQRIATTYRGLFARGVMQRKPPCAHETEPDYRKRVAKRVAQRAAVVTGTVVSGPILVNAGLVTQAAAANQKRASRERHRVLEEAIDQAINQVGIPAVLAPAGNVRNHVMSRFGFEAEDAAVAADPNYPAFEAQVATWMRVWWRNAGRRNLRLAGEGARY